MGAPCRYIAQVPHAFLDKKNMPSSEDHGAPHLPDVGQQESLLLAAAVAIVRLDYLRSGVASESTNRFVAEARGTLQAIKRALEQEPFGTDNATQLEASRDLLQTFLSDLASGARW
jgi:hypothetical protein